MNESEFHGRPETPIDRALAARVWQPISTAPMDGTEIYSVGYYQIPYRFRLYSTKSQEFKRGIKGRWQKMNEYGGWENADAPINWMPVTTPVVKE